MKLQKAKFSTIAKALCAIALLVILAMPMISSAQLLNHIYVPPGTTPNLVESTNAFLSVEPNPVGVGQNMLCVMWLAQIPPFATSALGGDSQDYTGMTLIVTQPDGTNVTVTNNNVSDPTGSSYVTYTPTTVGTYQFYFNYPGQLSNVSQSLSGTSNPSIIVQFLPSSYGPVNVTVQQAPIQYAPLNPGPNPNEYWAAPVEAPNFAYSGYNGNWLGISFTFGNGNTNDALQSGSVNDYTAPVSTGHVIWTKQIANAGLAGGEFGIQDYYTGLSYEARFNTANIIINGKMYFNTPKEYSNQGTECIDLATGQELWFLNGTTLNLGQLLNFVSENQEGVIPYLWSTGSTLTAYDPLTGLVVAQIANATTGRVVYDAQGDMLMYSLGSNYVQMWNSTLCFINSGAVAYTEPGQSYSGEWRPSTTPINWTNGVQFRTTIPTVTGQSLVELCPDALIAEVTNQTTTAPYMTVMGYSAVDGHQMWNYTISNFYSLRAQYNFSPVSHDVYGWFDQNQLTWHGYSALTGKQLWTAAPYASPWGFYTESYMGTGINSPTVDQGVMYSTGYDGIHAINMTDGSLLWWFQTPSPGFEVPYNSLPFYGGCTVAGGVVYAGNDEHSPNGALYNNYDLWAVNATTGQAMWNMPIGYPSNAIVADGILVDYSNYDGFLYALGKGVSATTVTATPGLGSNVMTIQGTVTDQSPGQTRIGIPAAGTPAISDDSMTPWMEYLYMQQPKPTNATGVPVTLSYTDPNHNTYNIATVTSDSSGRYAYQFTPTIPGLYTVFATFDGSNSYYSSSDETCFTYVPTTSTAAPTATPTTSVADTYFVPAIAGLFVLIIIVAIVLAILMLRKRP